MSNSGSQAVLDLPGLEVLTLAEVAAYLRVPEDAVLALVTNDTLPAQNISGEWRFLKRAVVEWLGLGAHFDPEFRIFSHPWMIDHPVLVELFQSLEKRILSKISTPEDSTPARGSKEAVLQHFGVFQDDADLEEQLASIRAQREAAGE